MTRTDASYSELRARAERLWAVGVDRIPIRRGGLRGLVTAPVMVLLRPLAHWYVAPLAVAQREFNDVALKLFDALDAHVARATDARRLDELDERLVRLERVRHTAIAGSRSADHDSAPPPPSTSEGSMLDYFAFEARMRGSTDDIRGRQAMYVAEFADAAPVLDIGCGRGEFLTLLREHDIPAVGLDQDPDMVAYCRAAGLDVEHGDAVEHLSRLSDDSLGGIFMAQVVEHLAPDDLVGLLRLAASKLRQSGVLVMETMNPLSLGALKNFFADLTHQQPLVPDTLVFLTRHAGFSSTEVRYLNRPAERERLQSVVLPRDKRFDDARAALDANIARLNDLLFGPDDYVVIAKL
jgi:SAM-dependent methyltransferase